MKAKPFLFGGSNPPKTTDTSYRGKATDLKTPDEGRKAMKKSRLLTTILRWAKTIAITVLLGLTGTVHLQPNAL